MPIGRRRGLGHLRAEAISLNRSFQPLRPLVERSRIVSLNARCAITQAGPLAAPLRSLIDEVETRFADVARTVANLVRNEERLTKYAEALHHLDQRITGDEAVELALSPAAAAEWEWEANQYPSTDARALLWRALLEARRELLDDLHSVQRWAMHIDHSTSKLQEDAHRQGFFIGFNATMEAARFADESHGLGAVAADITSYAHHMAKAIDSVMVQVRGFMIATAKAVKPVRRELHHAA